MLNLTAVGVQSASVERSWTEDDVLLYAVAVGAGQSDPTDELPFTTENSAGVELAVLPTFANLILGGDVLSALGPFDRTGLLHASQSFTVHRPLPTRGSVRSTATVTGIYDKGSEALVVIENTGYDVSSGELLATMTRSLFIRGEGGFGGDRGPSTQWNRPTRAPDIEAPFRTSPGQALLYRLTGDRNPLHSDPHFAARGGFDRPILHGMCTYGYTGRILLREVCASDPARFVSMEARFTKPVEPGDALTVLMWVEENEVLFRTVRGDTTVLDCGRLNYRPSDLTTT